MKITAITVWQMDLPLTHAYTFSGGRQTVTALDTTFVRIETDEGITGWGEGCPWGPAYLPAHGAGIRAALSLLAPALIGHDPRALDHVNRLMDITLPGHFSAKSPLDIACWDIFGQVAGQPLWRLLGAETPARVALNSSIPSDTPDAMVADIEAHRALGYRTHSAKLGGSDADADIARMEAVSACLEPGEQVTFDINRAWTPGIAIRILNATAARDWVEQPCETLDQCAHVAARVPQSIMLDECVASFGDHLEAWRRGACEGVKVKPNRVGGLTRAKRIRDFGVDVGWQMHIEDLGGSALADTAAFHLAASTPDENRLASWLGYAHTDVDPVPGQGVRNQNGVCTLPNTPGLGVVPDPNRLGDPVARYGAAA
ncbi:MAG: mandelate racemase/muconate lactonizing enzyme family protein [Pseudomonadota bacterium]